MINKHINIFLSSTFQDMQAERDYLKKYILPRLQNKVLQYGMTVHITDLRWGIDTTSEQEEIREAKVLRVCLDAIKRNRPYFIGLLGGRYGWIPRKERVAQLINSIPEQDRILLPDCSGRSVTEIEILFGALGSSEILPHSFFFFRNPDVYDTIPLKYQSQYLEQDINSKAKLESLQRRIIETCRQNGVDDHIQYYDTIWDAGHECISGLKEFGDNVYSVILNDILKYNAEFGFISQKEYEQQSFESFVIQRLDGFCGRKEIVSFLENFILDFDPLDINRINGYFLSGFSGSGKSSVFCKVYANLSARQKELRLVLLGHAAGITVDSCDPQKMLYKWIKQLSSLLNVSNESPNANMDLISIFSNLLIRTICAGYKPIILLDSYDSLEFPAWGNSGMDFLKKLSFIPYNVPFICTVLPNCVEAVVASRESYRILELELFSKAEALELIDYTLRANVKELPSRMIDMIISKNRNDGTPAYSSPLWLRMILSVLDEIGDKDFREINREKFDRDDLKITSYLERLIRNFPPEAETLFEQYIDLSCNYFPPNLVRTSLLFAALSGSGVSEQEIECMCPDQWDELAFANFAQWMRTFFRQDPITGRWTLGHNILKEVLKTHSETVVSQLRGQYIDILSNRLESDNSLRELLYQIIIHQDFDSFFKLIHMFPNCREEASALLMQTLKKEELLIFINNGIEQYCADAEKCYWIIDLLNSYPSYDESEKEFKINFYENAVQQFQRVDLLHCNDEVFENYILLQYELLNMLYQTERYEKFDILFMEFKVIICQRENYLSKKCHYDSFCLWILFDYANIPNMQRLRWGGHIPNEEKTRLSAEGTRRWLDMIQLLEVALSADKDSDHTKEIIKRIIAHFNTKFYSCDEIASMMSAIRMLGFSPDLFNDNEEISKTNHDIDFSDILKQIDEESRHKKRVSPKPEWEMISDSLPQLERSQQVLTKFLSSQINNHSNDDYLELTRLFIRLSDDLRTANHLTDALSMMRICAGLALNHYVFLPYIYQLYGEFSLYNISNDSFQPLANIAEWYASAGYIEPAVTLLEKAYCNSRLWLAFFPHNSALRHLLWMLQNCYCNTDRIARAALLTGEYLEFLFRYPLPKKECGVSPKSEIKYYVDLLRRSGQEELAMDALHRSEIWPNEQYIVFEDIDQYRQVRNFGDGYMAIAVPGNSEYCHIWGYANEKGQVLIEPRYNEAGCFIDGLAMVGIGAENARFGAVGMKYGYIDNCGNEIISLKYDYASSFYHGEALVSENGEFYYIDITGKKTRNFSNL